jgi:O-antigen/teichoic acid export membrane protein
MNDKPNTEQTLSHRLIKNVIWNFVGQLWMVLIGFFATPYIVRTLNVNFYGIYTLVWIIIGYFSFLQFGLGTAAVKYIAQYFANGQEEKIRRTFWACLIIYSLMGIVGTGAIAFLSRFIVERILKIPQELIGTVIFVIRLGSLGFLISMILGVVSGVIAAVGRFDILNLRGIILGTLQIGLTVFLLSMGLSLKEVIISNLLVDALGIYVLWILVKKILPFISRPVWDKSYVVSLFKFGGFVTISGVLGPSLLNIEKLFLTSLRPISSLTYYSVPFGLMDKLTIIRSSFSAVLFPTFSSLQDSGDKNINRELHQRSALYILFLYSFFVLFFIIFGRQFLAAWIGNNFAFNSSRILAILSLAGLINALAVPSMNALQGLNRPHIPALFHVIETILYIPCAYLFIWRFGGTGAALAWFLRVLLDTILLNQASCKLFGERIFVWYARLFYKGFIPVSVSGLALFGLRNFNLRFFSFVNIFGILLVFILYSCIVWKWGLDDFARLKAKQFLEGLLHK